MITVAAVIVTHNRLTLLKEAVEAVKAQSYPLADLIVVNNGSTDGTTDWLEEQTGITIIHQENIGAAGGFANGIRKGMMTADWIWVMDDDTICQPGSLTIMVEKLSRVPEKTGFIGSKCIWKDGKPHLMNLPAIAPTLNTRIPFNLYDEEGLLLIGNNSFVSMLVNAEAIRHVGLPYKEFFIWGDDQEFTRRITKAGYLGFYCLDSVVLHKTPINYFPDFYNDTVPNLWKHENGFRNEFYLVKRNKGVLYFSFWLPVKVAYTSLKLCRIRRDNRFKFVKVLIRAAWRSVFFNPQIVYPNEVPILRPVQ